MHLPSLPAARVTRPARTHKRARRSKASTTLSWLGSALKEQLVTATTAASTAPKNPQAPAPQSSGMDQLSPVPSYDALGATQQAPEAPGGRAAQQQQQPAGGLVFVEDEDTAPVARLPQLPVSSPPVGPNAPGTPLAAAPVPDGSAPPTSAQ